MRHELAMTHAKLFFFLYRLKLISDKRYCKLVDRLSVRTLAFQMKENPSGKSSKDK